MANSNAHIIRKAQADMKKAIKEMVTIMGVEAINHYKKSFADQGFTDDGFVAWRKRKDRKDTYKRGERSLNVGRAVLTKTGRLRRSLRKQRFGQYGVMIYTNVPYSEIHNEGGVINRKASERVVHFKGDLFDISTRQAVRGRFARKRNADFAQKLVVGEYSIRMPKRQFVGYSERLNRRLIKIFDIKIRSAFA